jgi:hypothetical protein
MDRDVRTEPLEQHLCSRGNLTALLNPIVVELHFMEGQYQESNALHSRMFRRYWESSAEELPLFR